MCPHGGQLSLLSYEGFFSKVNSLWGKVVLDIKFILSDTSEVNIVELTFPALLFRLVSDSFNHKEAEAEGVVTLLRLGASFTCPADRTSLSSG